MRTGARIAAVLGLAGALLGLASAAGAPPAAAHPLGNFTINRYAGIVLSPGRIEVRYVLDMAEIPTFQQEPAIDADADGTATADEKQAWADRTAPEVLANLSMTVDGRPVALRLVSDAMRFRAGQAGLPILYFTATYVGALPGPSGSARFGDSNYQDRIGWKEITVRSLDGVAVVGSSVPPTSVSGELTAYPKDLLASPLDVTSAIFGFRPGRATAGSGADTSAGSTVSGAPIGSGGSFAGLVRWRLTPVVLVLSLALALAFGAFHALGPGHGKTITAAYLVGSGARVGQAVGVGAAVALMHTASVLTLGLVLFVLARSFPAEQIYPWLTLATGAVALGLGVGLFVSRLRARGRGLDPRHGHTHPWDDHDHAQGHTHGKGHSHAHAHNHRLGPEDHPLAPEPARGGVLVLERFEPVSEAIMPVAPERTVPSRQPTSARGLVALAVAGGILPSPSAFVVLTGAISAHRIGYGLALIAAFSAGLAGALIGIGLLALRARAVVATRLRSRWTSVLPLISALVIVGFGVFFAARGLSQLT